MNFLISIIVPVYNVENYIDRCVLSLINQTYKNLEIILVNDGSTDNSGAICDYYASKDRRIKVFHIKNGGSSIARNYGLKNCTGDYIGFVDSDDFVEFNMFKMLIDSALYNKLKIVECNSIESTKYKYEAIKCDINSVIIEDEDTFLERVIKYKRFAVWRRLYHKSLLENRLFIENNLYEDVYFTIDILNEVSNVGFINLPLYIYNVDNLNSVQRSQYSIKKLNSINVAYYVLEQTKKYNKRIRNVAKCYVFYFLNTHYNSLYQHDYLDPEFYHRKKIKKTLTENLKVRPFNFYSFIIILLPQDLYKIFLHLNMKRIHFQQNLNFKIKNV